MPSGTGPWPAVILLHIGEFFAGDDYGGEIVRAAKDLAANGFYAAVVEYPLAPPNYIEGQPDHLDPASGRPPEQTDSVKAFIAAMKFDTAHCLNGIVGILGGSAGGSHAAFVAIDQNYDSLHWPFWVLTQRPKFVACLSGVYDMADRTPSTADELGVTTDFIYSAENYTGTACEVTQWNESPIGKLTDTNIVPTYAIRAKYDSMPASQQYYLFNAFHNLNVPANLYQMWEIPHDALHAFGYWDDEIGDIAPRDMDWLVKDRVIGYFNYFLKDGHSTF